MSSLSSISGSGSNPYQLWAQSIAANQTGASSSGSSSSTGSTSATGTSFEDQFISAITNAVQGAEQSGNTSNMSSVVQNTVNQFLQANGLDSSSTQGAGQLQGAGGHHHHHHHSSGSATASSSGTSSTTGSSGTSGTSDSSGASASTSGQQIVALLLELSGGSGSGQTGSGINLTA
jgi:hypothetical protein